MKVDAEKIIQLRAKQNWSQEQLSQTSGLSLRTIQRIENTGNASIESVRTLASVFEVDPNQLKVGDEDQASLILQAVKKGFVDFADFSGKASRFEYWWFFLFMILVLAVAEIIHIRLLQIAAIVFLLPLLSFGTRRLNDAGHSGWWQLLFLVPFGAIPVLILQTQESKGETDQANLP